MPTIASRTGGIASGAASVLDRLRSSARANKPVIVIYIAVFAAGVVLAASIGGCHV